MRLVGPGAVHADQDIPFVNVGERTNVTGSAKFRKLITAGDYAAALDVARDQVANGAQIIDVNMDEGLIDSEEGDGGLPQPRRRRARYRPCSGHDRQLQVGGDRGRAEMRTGQADRQLHLDEGRRGGVPASREARAACTGPPSSSWPSTRRARPTPRRARWTICTRAYDLLTEEAGFAPEDIIFDPNVFAIATGIEEHDNYGVDFIEAAGEITAHAAACSHLRRRLEPVLLVPRQRAGARGHARGLPLPRHPARHGHGDRQCRPARRLRHDRTGTARGLRGCRAQSTAESRRHGDRAPAGDRRTLQGHGRQGGEGTRSRLARVARRAAHFPRARQRHHGIHRRRHRRGAAESQTSPARHRRAR